MESFLKENKFYLVLLLVVIKCVSEILTREFELGPCYLQYLEPCANNSIQFYLFSSKNPRDRPVLLDNLSPVLSLDYNETIAKSYKMIIHGYGGHLDFNGSKQIRKGKSGGKFKSQIHCFTFSHQPNLPGLRNFQRHTFVQALSLRF